jgi:ribulose-phosphate 3-epimerase
MKKVAVSIHAIDNFDPYILKGIEGYDYIHLDVMDGVFVPNKQYNLDAFKQVSSKYDYPIIGHLMVAHPKKDVEKIRNYVDIVIFHIEIEEKVGELINYIKRNELLVGLAINPQTQVSRILPHLDKVDVVLIMGVNPGYSSQEMIPNTPYKIAELYPHKNEYSFLIDVDGGVNLKNALLLKSADILTSASAILKSDNPNEVIQKLKSIV